MAIQSADLVDKDRVLARLSDVKAGLEERYAVSQIGIFGSVAKAKTHEGSDLDIVVHMRPNMLKRACLRAELEEIFGKKVDVIRYWYGMNPYLKTRIDNEAVYV